MEYLQMPQITHEGNAKREIDQWIYETFVGPLEKYGFRLQAYSAYHSENLDQGFHMIKMELKEGTEIPLEGPIWNEIVAITNQDDDNQPHATHRYYMGDLWIFIPYYL